jgi:hypothetical protein
MSFVLTLLVIVAMLATLFTLVIGLWSMVYHGESGPFDSEHWMRYRVLLQAVALVALVAALVVGT